MMNSIRLFFIILSIKLSLFAGVAILPESTVAVVNAKAISEDDLKREVARLMPRSFIHSTVNEKKLKVVKEKAMKKLIENTLLYGYAKSINLTISSAEMLDTIKKIEIALGSKAILKERIVSTGMTFETFKKEVKKDLLLTKLYKKEIEYIQTDKELKEYYEKNKYKFKEPEKLRVRLIYVKNDPTDPDGKSKAKKRILEAAKELENGENFQFVAQNYSNHPSRVKGGDMGYLHRGMLDKEIEDQIYSIELNTISPVIEKDVGYYIVKVEEKAEQRQLDFNAVKEKLKKELKRKTEDKRKTALLEKLFSTAVIIK